MKENLEKDETEANYQQWEKVLSNINYRRKKLDDLVSNDKIQNGIYYFMLRS